MNNLSISLMPELYSQKIIKTRIFDINIDSKGIIKLDAPDWVNIAVYNETLDKWVLVKEHRNGIDKDVIEFMSGTVEKNEDPKVTALRELKEELGYDQVEEIEELYSEYVNPAFMNNKIHGYYVRVKGEPGNTDFDEDENVIPCYVDQRDIRKTFSNNGIISLLTLDRVIEEGFWNFEGNIVLQNNK